MPPWFGTSPSLRLWGRPNKPTKPPFSHASACQNQRYLAIRQYQQCVEALREQLDVEPDAETVQLYERILHNRPV